MFVFRIVYSIGKFEAYLPTMTVQIEKNNQCRPSRSLCTNQTHHQISMQVLEYFKHLGNILKY